MMDRHNIHILSNSATWLSMTSVIVVVLILDGIMTDIPGYDLKTQTSYEVQLFFSFVVFASCISQVVYLEIIRKKYIRSNSKYFNQTHLIVSIIQYIII